MGWLKKFGPAQNVLGPVKGQGISKSPIWSDAQKEFQFKLCDIFIFTWLFYGTSCSYRTSWSHRTSWSYRTPCSFELEWMIVPIQCHAFGLFFRTRELVGIFSSTTMGSKNIWMWIQIVTKWYLSNSELSYRFPS